ncbi:hypothetical protein BTR23_03865 [Alkalihalophilus pseudofirmus]|nr:hypothetical protein BTR23_03865 [Alkalihalophilus pseudofirmus]
MEVPVIHLPYSKDIIIYTMVLLAFILFISLIKEIKIDVIIALFFVQLITSLIPLLFNNSLNFFGSYLLILIQLLTFIIALQMNKINYKKVINIFTIFAIVIAFQTLITFLAFKDYFFYIQYKSLLSIPIGSSNFIAVFLTPVIIALISMRDKNFIHKAITLFLIFGLIITQSRGALLTLFVFLIGYYGLIFVKSVRNRKVSKLSKILLYLMITIGALSILFFGEDKDYTKLIYGYSSIIEEGSIINQFSSGRTELYFERTVEAFGSPIFGHGTVYDEGMKRSHNFIIDRFYESGLIGVFCTIFILYYWYNKIKPFRNDFFINYAFWFNITMIIQSLFEVSLFSTVYSDFIFFSLLGLSIARVKELKKSVEIECN